MVTQLRRPVALQWVIAVFVVLLLTCVVTGGVCLIYVVATYDGGASQAFIDAGRWVRHTIQEITK